ncbi:FtsJ-like methyltransferase family protein [Galdieria sulphuraria]|uniref:FtsJ-like methyltransferase family protein n=1 Tax=Galdieria sulphuraria TaxID=130081 RepID=M2W9E2_GALSU|nr:FtsJ-like methyltransferase family protein [Galdieria sulphuraria]EME32501.1 FtsJ-like methyltransferase family protein [Galdieria sulphuraria]|eukprot:XP_005709021.1 FtsJ-like methyltransferase family protein [Galdieria sulphuraria]
MTKSKVGKRRLDKYYHLAKEQGYRSRAAFKLIQLNRKYDLLGSARAVVDLCAAPGGWLQVARKETPIACVCVGVDIVPIRPIPGTTCLTHDITKESCIGAIRKALEGTRPDVILCDGSPSMGTAWLQDAYTQSELTLAALRLSVSLLSPNGSFVAKVFRSSEYTSLLYVMNQLFGKVFSTKPQASRAESAEIYVICTKFKDMKKIDQKLLDPRTVFKEQDEQSKTKKSNRLIFPHQKKRNRLGYDEENGTNLFRKCSVLDFIKSSQPIHILNNTHVLEFGEEGQAQYIKSLAITSADVLENCKDLQVLGPKDQRRLLHWRKAVLKELDKNKKSPEESNEEENLPRDEDSTVSSDFDIEKKQISKQEKDSLRKQKKALLKLSKRQKRMLETGELYSSNLADSMTESNLFSLPNLTHSLENLAEEDLKVRDNDETEEIQKDNKKEKYVSYSGEDYLSYLNEEVDQWHQQRLEKRKDSSTLESVNVVKDANTSNTEHITNRWYSHPLFTDELTGEEGQSNALDKRENSYKQSKQDVHEDDETSSSSESSDEEEDELSMDDKARALALASNMIRKKSRQELMDDAWNRHVFDDEYAPKWFLEEEKKYRRASLVTSEERVEEIKAALEGRYAQYLNKKEQEALWRKKRKESRKLRRLDAEIERVQSQTELSKEEKDKSIQNILKRVRKNKKNKRQVAYAVLRPGGGKMIVSKNRKVPKGAKIKYVDRRMKKDNRKVKKKK